MYHFSIEKLKSYAGKNYVDTLTEWIEDTTFINERTSLISIIKIIYGTKIFVNSNFRKDLLLSMTKEEIQKFAIDNGFDLKNYSDLRIFINEIAQKRNHDIQALASKYADDNQKFADEYVKILCEELSCKP